MSDFDRSDRYSVGKLINKALSAAGINVIARSRLRTHDEFKNAGEIVSTYIKENRPSKIIIGLHQEPRYLYEVALSALSAVKLESIEVFINLNVLLSPVYKKCKKFIVDALLEQPLEYVFLNGMDDILGGTIVDDFVAALGLEVNTHLRRLALVWEGGEMPPESILRIVEKSPNLESLRLTTYLSGSLTGVIYRLLRDYPRLKITFCDRCFLPIRMKFSFEEFAGRHIHLWCENDELKAEIEEHNRQIDRKNLDLAWKHGTLRVLPPEVIHSIGDFL